MTFEEQFPSLKNAGVDSFADEEGDNVVEMEEEWFPSCAIEEFCLDKQKVKYAHDQLRKLIKDKFLLAEIDAMDKELGL